MSRNLSAEYYQEIKKDYKKNSWKITNLSKEEKEKNDNMAVIITKISQKIKNKKLVDCNYWLLIIIDN